MGGLKTFCFGLVVTVFAGATAHADTAFRDHVANCVGRLSAQLEHQWLVSDEDAGQTEILRNSLADILEAITTAETARSVLSRRINAKNAHSSLLTRAAFNSDPRDARWANKRAQQGLRECDGIALVPETDGNAADQNRINAQNDAGLVSRSALATRD